MAACVNAASKAGNVVALNSSTDGVAYEVQCNVSLTFNVLAGKQNHMGVSVPCHNVKNLRYQLIGGSCFAVIGNTILILCT
jgi:hypothetical protein